MTPPELRALYEGRLERARQDAERWSSLSRSVSNFRGLSFIAAAGGGLSLLLGKAALASAAVTVLGLVAFAALVVWHARVLDRESAAQREAAVSSDALLRGTEQFKKLASDGRRFSGADHPYADDLDLFGPGSLFQRLSVAHTRFGEDALARVLRVPAPPAEIARRQAAVQALAGELDLRQRFESHGFSLVTDERKGETVRRPPPEPETLFKWALETTGVLSDGLVVLGARVLPLVTLAGAVIWSRGITPFVFLGALVVQAALLARSSAACGHAFAACSASHGAFRTYAPMLELIEGLTLDAELLREQKARLENTGRKPSRVMAELDRILGWYDLRYNGLVYPIVNLLTLWDVHCTIALEHWRKRAGSSLEGWFQVIGEFEALSSLAGFRHDEPDFCFPVVKDDAPPFHAEALGHPLIARERRVTNDVVLETAGSALLVTGSNMSGKSTMLRSMGLAAVLAQAGAPVCARRLELAPAVIRTSLRVSDSLDSGVSHFYAEVKKLKSAIDATAQSGKVLFLLDEVLHGTNSRERQLGARWLLAELLQRGAAGAISTHDEELCRLPPELMSHVRLVHFRETVENDQMTFDYRLREGPVKAGNALRVMRLAGLDVPL
ncbi:MAG TPA: MutS family DNA mismatch repair protein [Polyangiaceae bacterium]|nr:MutS family DNA mismatch repair protein [Polyangiaceae bacterium]